ncbi:MAG: CBS domain-containing protein [Betaproteobacteria bacterium]|nr:CBS domain-containing protein [Betaproteobacteria bacterium]
MFSQRVKNVIEPKRLLTAAPDESVRNIAKMMARKKVSAVVVVEDRRLVGIFTERDAVFRVIARGLDPDRTRLEDVMTKTPKSIAPDESFGYALLVMHENGFRHLPVVEDGVPIGIVSSRNAIDPDMEEFVSEARRRHHIRQRV